jgi:hypothetical protein
MEQRQWLERGYQEKTSQMRGARINIELDTVVIAFQYSADYCPLSLLYGFLEMEHKTRVKHVAVDLQLWRSFMVQNSTTEKHALREFLGEYSSLQALNTFGTPESPICGSNGGKYPDPRQEKKVEIQ